MKGGFIAFMLYFTLPLVVYAYLSGVSIDITNLDVFKNLLVDGIPEIVLCMIILVVPATCFTHIQAKNLEDNKLRKADLWTLLFLSSGLILLTILCGYETISAPSLVTSTEYRISIMISFSFFPLQLLFLEKEAGGQTRMKRGDLDLLPYCPAILDLYDGNDMLITKLHSINPAWVQVGICLAVITFYIPSLWEIYHLRYPELRDESMLSERRARLAQCVSSCIFLVLRVVLFAYSPHEIGFAVKTIIRLNCHYKTLSNLPQHYAIDRTTRQSV